MPSMLNKYVRIPNNSTPLPTTVSPTHSASSSSSISTSSSPSKKGFGRARTRWALIGLAAITVLLFFGVASSDSETSAKIKAEASKYADKLHWKKPKEGYSSTKDTEGIEFNRWRKGSDRQNLHYDSPFNPEDLTMTEEECDTFFPGLYKEIDRSVDYYTEHNMTAEYLDKVCDDGIWTHARVLIHNNKVYLKYFQQSAFTRINSALGLLHQSVAGAREQLPNAEFCLSLNDWGSMGKFSLDRAPYLEDVWLLPDYGFYSWPEVGIGSYTEAREKTLQVERAHPWQNKTSKLFWRGSMGVGTADRKAMFAAAEGHDWSDIKPLNWGDRQDFVSMVDHCKWKFHAFPEGITYSGRLRYLQNCKSVIVTHEPRWIQHWTHLYNPDPESPDQNIVFVPEYHGDKPGVEVEDERGQAFRDTTWMRLPEVMDELLKDDKRAERIASNQWSFFRERYVSPASAACYWRKAIKKYAGVQQFQVNYTGTETAYETFIVLGNKLTGIA